MSFDLVRGQDRAVGLLRRALARNRLAHALIFAGPAGVGKRTTATALSAALLCHQEPDVGCGACEDCHLVEVGAHPDLFVEDLARARDEKPTATRLSIDQIRRVRSRLAMRAVRGDRKVGLIDQAELLTIDAQNALLKTLEEPPGRTTLVLVTTNPDALLGTIRSRCQCVLFAPLDRAVVSDLLTAEGVAPETAAEAAALCEGSLDRARELASDGELEQVSALREKLSALPRSTIPEVLDLAAALAGARGEKGKAEQARSRAIVLDWCRQRLLSAAAKAGKEAGPASESGVDALAAVRRALRRLERAYATTREFEQNANAHLAWDRLLLDLRELR